MKGFVYLLCDGEHFKIGMTKSTIEKRISQLQTGNSNEIYISSYHQTNYPYKIEQMMHIKYGSSRVKNEWFDLTVEQVVNFRKYCDECEATLEVLKDNPFIKLH